MARKGGAQGGRPPAPQSWAALSRRSAPAPAAAGDPLAQTYRRALDLHRRGELRQAGLLYQQVVAANASHAEARHGLDMVLHQMGKSDGAETMLRRAIELSPRNPVFHANLGAVLVALGRPDEAVESYRRANRLEPDVPAGHAGLGVALLALGRAEEAAQAERRAIRLKPDFALAYGNLGRALAALGRSDEALASLDRAVAIDPALIDLHAWRGDVLAARGELEAALDAYRAAIRMKPEHVAAHLGIARVLAVQGRHEGAADNFRAAIYTEPSAVAYAGLARSLVALARLREAADAYDMAIRLSPGDKRLADERAALPGAPAQDDAGDEPAAPLTELEREEARNRIAVEVTPGNPVALGNLGSSLVGLGRLAEGRDYYRRALAARPDYFLVWSELLFVTNYLGDEPVADMVAEARRYGEAVAAKVPARRDHANDVNPERRLRVGLVSADLHAHPVARFLEAVLAEIDGESIELFAYDTGKEHDELTARLRGLVRNWREAAAWSDDELEAAILADGIDILVDLSGHTGNNRLAVFARKPAPVAFTWIGYFATTGLKAIDYVLATPWVVPPEEEWQWVEKPWHLPETYLCFSPPRLAVPLAPPPALRNGYVTFGSANNLNKLSDPTLETWADVLRAVPASRLLLRSRPLADAKVAAETRGRFARQGIDVDRLILAGAVNDYGTHLSRYNDIDIALDPSPYAGGTTTVEALWMGVPVLTLKGDRYVAHMGENILHNVGLPEWIAADRADYVSKAAAFAADMSALTGLRQKLRHRLLTSPLCDAPRFARHLEDALRGMWRQWCEGRG